MIYTGLELLTYFIIYSFAGWLIEVSVVAIKDRRFRNRGFLNLPFCMMYGIIMDILIILWPEMVNHGWFKFVAAFVVFVAVQSVSEFMTRRICGRMMLTFEDITPFNGKWMNLIVTLIYTAVFWVFVEVVHPIVYIFVSILPTIPLKITDAVILAALISDVLLTLYIMYHGRGNKKIEDYVQRQEEYKSGINDIVYKYIWGRLEKAYPNIAKETEPEEAYVFAQGICLDKIIWVFLTSAFIGDLIEMVYCRVVGGTWMSRSSVLYGPFSIVWGLGAVVLTIVLSRFQDKDDRYIFLVGALLGGVYEYGCSLFTEIVLGTVFWDYSWMPFNIGGRTNVLYMAFWGILSVVWIKIIYPRMSTLIEKLPLISGKIITWALIAFMICNALLSAMAMLRYTERQDGVAADTSIETFLDANYEDELIEKVWPNMVITK